MKQPSDRDRRQCPRINEYLPIRLAVNGFDFATSTQNVSCTGAYCRVDKYMPPFTRVMVRLSLPVAGGSRAKELDVECRGVIVRTDDGDDGGFNIAIFFNDIKDIQKKRISQYIAQFLPDNA